MYFPHFTDAKTKAHRYSLSRNTQLVSAIVRIQTWVCLASHPRSCPLWHDTSRYLLAEEAVYVLGVPLIAPCTGEHAQGILPERLTVVTSADDTWRTSSCQWQPHPSYPVHLAGILQLSRPPGASFWRLPAHLCRDSGRQPGNDGAHLHRLPSPQPHVLVSQCPLFS